MPRIKPKEIVRRDAVPSRRAEVPILAVHADQEPSRYVGQSAQIAARGVELLGNIYAQRNAAKRDEQRQADYSEGQSKRREEELNGLHGLPEYILEEASEDYRRGYHESDALLKIRNWHSEMAVQLAQAEPDADYADLVQASRSELLQHPAFQDPRIRDTTLAALEKADASLYSQHQKTSAVEMLTRQEEAATALIRDKFESGEPITNEGLDSLYAYFDRAEFGYLGKRDVDALVAKALMESLATGKGDIPALLDLLENRKDEHGVSLMDGRHGEDIRKAAAHGAQVQQAGREEAQKNALVQAERPLRDLAKQGRLTDTVIDDAADQLGLSGQDRLTFIRRWYDKQEQGLKALQDAAEKRAKAVKEEKQQRENSMWLTEEQNRGILDKRLQAASALPEAQRQAAMDAVLEDAIAFNIVPTYYQNVLRLGGYDNAGRFSEQAALYQQLRNQSHAFASKAAGSRAAVFDQYHQEVTVAGHDAQTFLARMGSAKQDAEAAAYGVTAALKDAKKEYARVEIAGEEHERPATDWFHIQRRANAIANENPGVSGAAALKAAVEEFDNSRTLVNGRRVPNHGIPAGGEEGVSLFVREIAKRAGQPESAFTAYPLPGSEKQWVVTAPDGFPVTDPDTGERVLFNPSRVARHWRDWSNGLAETRVRNRQLEREMERLRFQQTVPKAGVGNFQNAHTDALNKRKFEADQAAIDTLMASPEYQQMLRDREFRTTEISGIPVDFLRYLSKQKPDED